MLGTACIPRTKELMVVVEDTNSTASSTGDNKMKTRRLSKDFQQLLDKAFNSNTRNRQAIYKDGEKHFAGEMFRFYAAILEFESQYASDKRRGRLQALKLVSTFVEPGSMYENGCLSSATRQRLLQRKVTCVNFFDDAKYEVANDIQTNPVLRAIVERFAIGNIVANSKSSPTHAIPNPAE